MNKDRLVILFDNRLHHLGLKKGWGFACLVETGGMRVLFDTGNDPGKLAFNMKRLEIDPASMDAVVLSHHHWDHTGGLGAVTGNGFRGPVYISRDSSGPLKQRLSEQQVDFVEVFDRVRLNEKLSVGPQMGGRWGIKEIALSVQTPEGIVLVTGCAHPGILRMIKQVKEIYGETLHMVVGGFHWFCSPVIGPKIKGLQKLEVRHAAPGHCTGEKGIRMIRRAYDRDFIETGAGLSISLA